MKRTIVVLLALLLALPFAAHALEESESFYVNDPANVLSAELEDHVCLENYRLYDLDSGAEVVVVAVDFLGGKTPEAYAYDVFNDWALGDKNEKNGVLLLLSPGEEKYWIMTGDGLDDVLPASALDAICSDRLSGVFASGRYDEAVTNAFDDIVARIDGKYGVTSAAINAWYNGSGEVNISDWTVSAPVQSGTSATNAGSNAANAGSTQAITPPSSQSSGRSGFSKLLGLILLIIVIWLLFRLIRGMFRLSTRGTAGRRIGHTYTPPHTVRRDPTPPPPVIPPDPWRSGGAPGPSGPSGRAPGPSGPSGGSSGTASSGGLFGSLFGGGRTSGGSGPSGPSGRVQSSLDNNRKPAGSVKPAGGTAKPSGGSSGTASSGGLFGSLFGGGRTSGGSGSSGSSGRTGYSGRVGGGGSTRGGGSGSSLFGGASRTTGSTRSSSTRSSFGGSSRSSSSRSSGSGSRSSSSRSSGGGRRGGGGSSRGGGAGRR